MIGRFQNPFNDWRKQGKILYDADSTAAEAIRAAAGSSAVGLSGNPELIQPGVLTVENDYLRMELFDKSSTRISSSDSIPGAALNLRRGFGWVLETTKAMDPGELYRWYRSLKSHGVALEASPLVPISFREMGKISSLVYSGAYSSSSRKVNGTPNAAAPLWRSYGEILSPETFDTAYAWGSAMSQARARMPEEGGVVVFGAGTEMSRYASLVDQVGAYLGSIGEVVAQGGAGGVMERIGRAVLATGGYSIGIPLGENARISSETRDATSAHSLTIHAPGGYEGRIPLLLYRRKAVLIAPGAKGTIREIATALFLVARDPEHAPRIIFISREYFGGLVDWLRGSSSNFPESVRKLIYCIDSAEELPAALGLKP